MKRYIPGIIGIVLVLSSGLVHGLKTGRWVVSNALGEAAERLKNVPMRIGEWDGEDSEISEAQLKAAEAVGHLSRRYQNRSTGDMVHVLILSGRSGPIAVHPPTVCFTSAGFGLSEPPKRYTVRAEDSTPTGELWLGDFSRSSTEGDDFMRTFWSWNATGEWVVPDNPRFEFARYDNLYKMYVTRELTRTGRGEEIDDGPCVQFMQVFIPELSQALNPAPIAQK